MGECIADSMRTLIMHETNHSPVHYFPPADVRSDLIEKSDYDSFWPFKGVASYYSVRVGDKFEKNIIWSYEAPFDEGEDYAGYMAFFENRVKLKVG